MLPATTFVAWYLALYLVVITRDLFAVLFAVTLLANVLVVVLSDDGVAGTAFSDVIKEFAVTSYGGLSGYALAAALGSRALIPVHSFSNSGTHVAGATIVISVAFIPHAVVILVGATTTNPGGLIAHWILFGLLVLAVIGVLIASFVGRPSFWVVKYRDAALRKAPPLPLSRLAAEVVLFGVLVAAALFLWPILSSGALVAWPQWTAGIVSILAVLCVLAAMYYTLRKRHAMDRVHFDCDTARVSWAAFIGINAALFVATAVIWLVFAESRPPGIAEGTTLCVLSAVTLLFATCIKLLPLRRWRRGYNQLTGQEHATPAVSAFQPRNGIITTWRPLDGEPRTSAVVQYTV